MKSVVAAAVLTILAATEAGRARAEAPEAQFVPHRAVYVGERHEPSGGRYGMVMTHVFADVCEEWRWETTIVYRPFGGALGAWSTVYSGREAKDGSRLSFEHVSEDLDRRFLPRQIARGEARRGAAFAFGGESVFISEEVFFSTAALIFADGEFLRGAGKARALRFLPPWPNEAEDMLSVFEAEYEDSALSAREVAAFGEILEGRRVWSADWRDLDQSGERLRILSRNRMAEGGLLLEERLSGSFGVESYRLEELEIREPEPCRLALAEPSGVRRAGAERP